MTKKLLCLFAAVASIGALNSVANADHIWINEFHYDNIGVDAGEFIEVGIRTPNGSGLNASDYVISLYNGSDNQMYADPNDGNPYLGMPGTDLFNVGIDFTASNPFSIANSTSQITLYTLMLPENGLQNGSPDGIALTSTSGTGTTFIQFLSYEGTMTADRGLAAGQLSMDIGANVFETNSSALTSSVFATGTGIGLNQFGATSYQVSETGATPGAINQGQVFAAAAIPEPGSLIVLAGMSVAGLMVRRRK